MMYFGAAVAAAGVFIIAAKRSRRVVGRPHGRGDLPNDLTWSETEIDLSEPNSQADAGEVLRLALKRLAPIMASQSIEAEIAASPGLVVRMRATVLGELVEEMLAAVIHAAPLSRILLTAAAHGDRVLVSVTDDVPGADPEVRRAGVRGLTERVAARGGMLDVDVSPEEGTTTTLQLAAARTYAQPMGAPIVLPVQDRAVLHEESPSAQFR
jgi:signal transduction histidine kinase